MYDCKVTFLRSFLRRTKFVYLPELLLQSIVNSTTMDSLNKNEINIHIFCCLAKLGAMFDLG